MSETRVYLDHLIKRQSIRYYSQNIENRNDTYSGNEDRSLRYDDVMRRDGWVTTIRKPDFQRETNAWTPKDCVDFLDSIVFGRIIPSIILWTNPENGLVFVLDGAHRLSVLRAWMLDDWGDKAIDYYQRKNFDQIKESAAEVRSLVRNCIGSFSDYFYAFSELNKFIEDSKAPKAEMDDIRYRQATFYQQVVSGLRTLSVQWEKGDYDSAEKSFLRINRSGQTLDPWEATLIEYRNSSYARCILSIANGDEQGHYWPTPSTPSNNGDIQLLKNINEKTPEIFAKLFVPPFKTPISDLNVPFMVAPEYFQKHKYLLEIIPLITEKSIAYNDEKQIEILKRDNNKPAGIIIKNGNEIIEKIYSNLDNLVGSSSNSRSLSIIPLFYWYNNNGKFVRALFYGFVYWLLSGTDDEIKRRKLAFSINRDRFEEVLFTYKNEIASSLQLKSGAGLKATLKIADFFQDLLILFSSHVQNSLPEINEDVIRIIKEKGLLYNFSNSNPSNRRLYSKQDKSTINIRELFVNSIRCHICGGIVNIQQGLQYDHVIDYAKIGFTDPESGKPTHPFCNNFKKQIQEGRLGNEIFNPPSFNKHIMPEIPDSTSQLSFWGENDFPE